MRDDDAGQVPAGRSRRPSIAVLMGTVAAGVAAGVLGTLLHGHLLGIRGILLPVGALAALALATSLFLLSGLWARNIAMSAVAGAVAYAVVALTSASSKTLVLTGSSEEAPGTTLAGNLWLFGIVVVTLLAVAIGARVLRPPARRRGSTPVPGPSLRSG